MHIRIFAAVVTGIAFLLMISTQDLRAVDAPSPVSQENLHVVAKAELHDAVVASSAEAAKTRKSVQAFLSRSEIKTQFERMGFDPADVSSRVALLSDAEILRLHSQIMDLDQQAKTAGMSTQTWIGVAVAIAAVIIVLLIVRSIGG